MSHRSDPSHPHVVALTDAWLRRAVIGLNLCPFAKGPLSKGQVRHAVSDATDTDALLGHLIDELQHLADTPAEQIETTLLIHPWVLDDFAAYNDFLDVAEAALQQLGLEGVLQVASFHPDYRFADSDADDLANATNRSPYPMLHLLREASIDRAVEAFPEPDAIIEANLEAMRRLGAQGWLDLQQRCREDAAAATIDPATATPQQQEPAAWPSPSRG